MAYETIFARSFSRNEKKKMGCGAFMGCFVMAFTFCTVFKPSFGPLHLINLEQSMTFFLPINDSSMAYSIKTKYMVSQLANKTLSDYKFIPRTGKERKDMLVQAQQTGSNRKKAQSLIQNYTYKRDQKRNGLSELMSTEEISKRPQSYIHEEIVKPTPQNFTNSKSQVYEVNGDIRIHGNSSTIFIASTEKHNINSWTIKPYARIDDKAAMAKVRKFKIINQHRGTTPPCTRNFTIPAIIFSVGGYTGNHFHDFTDVLIPLYLTSQQFNGTVIFLVADKQSWWTSKYRHILGKLSKYDVIDIDNENEVLCFSRMIIGLKAHKEFSIDSTASPHYSVRDFRKFLRNTYSLDRGFINGSCQSRRPRLLIISRKKTRHLKNEREVAKLARSLGFDVTVREMEWRVSVVAQFVNSFDVMVGVHGAGITNMVFLPENAVVIQIVPLGLDELAKHYFAVPAKDMNLRHIEYKVSVNESSLVDKYPLESEVFRDPSGVHKKGWHSFRSVYLDNQDVNVDLSRFRKTLLKAVELVCS